MVTDQSQENVAIPARQTDRPITGDGPESRGQLQIRDRITLDDAILDALLEPDHKMGSDIEQAGEQIEREITAIEKISPTGAPIDLGGRFQIMDFAGGREDELLRHAIDPIEDAGDLGSPRLLTICGPIESGQRQFDEA